MDNILSKIKNTEYQGLGMWLVEVIFSGHRRDCIVVKANSTHGAIKNAITENVLEEMVEYSSENHEEYIVKAEQITSIEVKCNV